MKRLVFLFFVGLLLAAPASQLSARVPSACACADETLPDATVQQVLEAAAPQIGESAASLYAQYQGGTVTIADLGPIRGGHRYVVTHAGVDWVTDIVLNG